MWGKKVKTAEATIVEAPKPEVKPETIVTKKAISSIISAETNVLGSVVSSGDLIVDGTVEGDIRCGLFTVGKDGVVHGNVIAETATIRGNVKGNVTARTIMLAGNSSVEGDLTHSVLIIEEGGAFEGRSRRVADPLAEAALAIEKKTDADTTETKEASDDASENKEEDSSESKVQNEVKISEEKEIKSDEKSKDDTKSKDSSKDESVISKEVKEAFALD